MLRAQYIPVSRLHLSRYVIGSSKNAPRAALAGKRAGCRPGRASPRGTHGTCSTNTQLKSIAFAITRWSHTHCGRASTLETLDARAVARGRRGSRSTPATHTTHTVAFLRIIMCGKAGKPSEFRARSRQKAPTPCTNELRQAFTSTARQDGFLERMPTHADSTHPTIQPLRYQAPLVFPPQMSKENYVRNTKKSRRTTSEPAVLALGPKQGTFKGFPTRSGTLFPPFFQISELYLKRLQRALC